MTEILPVASFLVNLPIRRVCEGFNERVHLAVFDKREVALICCFHHRGKHYHVPVTLPETREGPRFVAQVHCSLPKEAAETVLMAFDLMNAQQRAQHEVE